MPCTLEQEPLEGCESSAQLMPAFCALVHWLVDFEQIGKPGEHCQSVESLPPYRRLIQTQPFLEWRKQKTYGCSLLNSQKPKERRKCGESHVDDIRRSIQVV